MSRGSQDLWWERRRLWLPAALFALVGVALLVGYRVVLAGRLGLQARVVEERERTLAELTAEREATEAMLRRARAARLALDSLYGDRLGTQAARLTAVMAEIKSLARQAGLVGVEAISYSDVEVKDVPLVQKSIAFRAAGGYEQLRSFINLLELTPGFLTLESIRVTGDAGSGQLQLEIRLSTLFATSAGDEGGDA